MDGLDLETGLVTSCSYWGTEGPATQTTFRSFDEAYAYFDELIEGFEKVYCGLSCG